jgi:hypothetical protein
LSTETTVKLYLLSTGFIEHLNGWTNETDKGEWFTAKPPNVEPVKVNVPKPMPINAELTTGEKLAEAGKEIVNEVVVPVTEGIVKSFLRRLLERIRL